MDITIKKTQAIKIGYEKLIQFGLDRNLWWQNASKSISLVTLTPEALDRLESLLKNYTDVYGVKGHLRDIESWRGALAGGSAQGKVKDLKTAGTLMTVFIAKTPGQRVYKKEGNVYFAYFVKDITYTPTKHHMHFTEPEHLDITFAYQDYKGEHEQELTYYASDAKGSVVDMLGAASYYAETDELKSAYDAEIKRFVKLSDKLGKQFYGFGAAEFETKKEGWWWRRAITIQMERERVVIDVFKEADDDEDDATPYWMRNRASKRVVVTNAFWANRAEDDSTTQAVDLPVHPVVVVFNLRRHMRMTTHISNLKKYNYDEELINKLVMDDTRKALVRLLIEQQNTKYRDIISNKSGGAIVMLCGSPGTGKTLTAEVFAESEKRPLYSVQCSQLGTTPEELEAELMKVLTRAKRWDAVLLLDECDVYVHKRGDNIHQNALVGVFLRVLEYHDAILFMTTNRVKDVDDAVLSRCTARLDYQNPTTEQQSKIWRIQVDSSKADMDDKEIAKVVAENPKMSGRDVKNLLKLALLVNADKPITAKTIEFVKQFKPV